MHAEREVTQLKRGRDRLDLFKAYSLTGFLLDASTGFVHEGQRLVACWSPLWLVNVNEGQEEETCGQGAV